MSYQLTRRTVVTAKTESSAGVDASPTAASNAMLLFGEQNPWKPNIKATDKPALTGSLTNQKDLIGRELSDLTLNTVLMSRGDALGAPWFDPLLKACGFAVAAGGSGSSSSWVYTPISTGFSTATIYTYLDGLLTKALGCLGTFSLNMPAGDAPDLSFTMQGTYTDPVNTAFPTPTLPTDYKSMVQNAALAIGAYNSAAGLVAQSIKLDWGAANRERPDVSANYGFKGIAYQKRSPMLTIVVECEDTVTNKNFFTYLNSGQNVADGSMDNITWQHSHASTSIIKFTVRAPQLKSIGVDDKDGGRIYTLGYKVRNTTFENEAQIEFVEHV